MNTTNSLEAAFAIGTPAKTAADKTCTRCKGTGWWSLGRRCFKCGGEGHAERLTNAVRIRDKRAHIDEVRGIVAADVERLATVRFGRKQLESAIAKRTAQLAQLEAELAALEAA